MKFEGVLRHEFLMQIRRKNMWITMTGLGALFLTLTVQTAPASQLDADVAEAAVKLNWLAPLLAGFLVADRLTRDRRLRVSEVAYATGTRLLVRVWGKYLGATAALAVPLAMIWLMTLARFAVIRGQPISFLVGAEAFAVIEVPGMLFATGFALVFPAVINPVLFRVSFAAYWVWANLMPAHDMPTLSGTPLAPMGDYARAGIFGGPNPFLASGVGAPDHTTVATAAFSIILLVLIPAGAVTIYAASDSRVS